MRAVVLSRFDGPLAVEQVTLLPLGPRDVRVQTGASGVCHSDFTVASGGFGVGLPLVMGHEGAGTVVEVGSAVVDVTAGDRVVVALKPTCGVCFFCCRGQAHLCELGSRPGSTLRVERPDGSGMPAMSNIGSMAEVMTVDAAHVVPVRTDLPFEQIALLACGVTTGIGAVLNTAAVEPGSSVAVIGCGGVGQSVIQGARIAGAATIIAIDPVPMKRDAALKFGAHVAIDPSAADVVDAVRKSTAGRGADYVFDVVSAPATVQQSFDAARRGGSVVIVGMARSGVDFTFPGFRMMAEGKRVLGSFYGSANSRRDIARLVAFAERGLLDLGSMVSRQLKLEEVGAAFEALRSGEAIRSVLVP